LRGADQTLRADNRTFWECLDESAFAGLPGNPEAGMETGGIDATGPI